MECARSIAVGQMSWETGRTKKNMANAWTASYWEGKGGKEPSQKNRKRTGQRDRCKNHGGWRTRQSDAVRGCRFTRSNRNCLTREKKRYKLHTWRRWSATFLHGKIACESRPPPTSRCRGGRVPGRSASPESRAPLKRGRLTRCSPSAMF